MIRFCDKEVYTIEKDSMTRGQMLSFFLKSKENREAVLMIYDESGGYYGCVTYSHLLKNHGDETYIIKGQLEIDEKFWDDAAKYFRETGSELCPVKNRGVVVGFCYDDGKKYASMYSTVFILKMLEKNKLYKRFDEAYPNVNMICIIECNEVAYRVYQIFKKCGYDIYVLGEAWKWFGVESTCEYCDYPTYQKLYVYAEGIEWFSSKNNEVNNPFEFLRKWVYMNSRILTETAISDLVSKKVNIAKVIFPRYDKIIYRTDKEKYNKVKHIRHDKLEWLEEDIERQREHFGEKEFEYLKKDMYLQMFNEGLSTVIYGIERGKKIDYIPYCRNRVYILGPCVARGMCNVAEHTLMNYMQKNIEKYGYEVVRISVWDVEPDKYEEVLNKLPIKDRDIILILDNEEKLNCESDVCDKIFMLEEYNNQNRDTWMNDDIALHINYKGNECIANAICEKYLYKKINELSSIKENSYIQKGDILSDELQAEVKQYVDEVKIEHTYAGIIGSIIMNCNPFTYGHRYLIEYASSKVDLLYIFIVEEDRSFFSFEDRYAMVKEGTKDLGNVVVVPSSRWVLSYDTMPIYFEKSMRVEEKVDARVDLEIFARYIAPALGITKRFVGEEPNDKITRQYNEQMSEILSDFDIELEEIKRKECGGRVISASYVRKCMQEDDMEALHDLVPDTTYKYCEKYKESM